MGIFFNGKSRLTNIIIKASIKKDFNPIFTTTYGVFINKLIVYSTIVTIEYRPIVFKSYFIGIFFCPK